MPRKDDADERGDKQGDDSCDNDAHSPAAQKPSVVKGPSAKAKQKRPLSRRRARKDRDAPRRPLSAYNLFFRDERLRILAERSDSALGMQHGGQDSPKEKEEEESSVSGSR